MTRTLCMIFGLVYQKLQRSKHCILSEHYGMRDHRKICDGYVLFTWLLYHSINNYI